MNLPGYHTVQSQSPRGIILRRVNLPGASYCAESISPGYDTPSSHVLKFLLKCPRGMIPRRVNLPGVSYHCKSISPGYHTRRVNKNFRQKHDSQGYDTPASQSPRGIIPQRVSFFNTKVGITLRNLNQNRKYLNTLIRGPGWFE